MFDAPALDRICRESYTDPAELYQHLIKRSGMTLVTVTDHDSIDAAEALRGYPDFFLSEEVTTRMPSGTRVHLGVYGITERDHTEIQRRRNDFMALSAYLTERKLFFSVNHVFSGLTGRRAEDDFIWFGSYVPAFEVRNGQMLPGANRGAERIAKRLGKVAVAGSDAHTMAGAGLTFTEVPSARNAEEFLAGLREGQAVVGGEHGSYGKLTADVYRIIKGLFRAEPWTAMLLPLTGLVPAFTAVHWVNEVRFYRKWAAMMAGPDGRARMPWNLGSGLQGNWAS